MVGMDREKLRELIYDTDCNWHEDYTNPDAKNRIDVITDSLVANLKTVLTVRGENGKSNI